MFKAIQNARSIVNEYIAQIAQIIVKHEGEQSLWSDAFYCRADRI